MEKQERPSPAREVERLYEESESRTARAFEELVSRDSFGELLAKTTENVAGLTKISTGVFDLVLRNLRLAGRQDITRLARQLARVEDKLEQVLQEVERVQERDGGTAGRGRSAATGTSRSPASGTGRAPASNGRGTSGAGAPRRRARSAGKP